VWSFGSCKGLQTRQGWNARRAVLVVMSMPSA
jgi:hypothetical protein